MAEIEEVHGSYPVTPVPGQRQPPPKQPEPSARRQPRERRPAPERENPDDPLIDEYA